jgi:hypothetical protein
VVRAELTEGSSNGLVGFVHKLKPLVLSGRLRWSQASWRASSASLSEPSIR